MRPSRVILMITVLSALGVTGCGVRIGIGSGTATAPALGSAASSSTGVLQPTTTPLTDPVLASFVSPVTTQPPADLSGEVDCIIQAGHQNTPDTVTGSTSRYGNEIDWTPVVAERAAVVLQQAGIRAVKIDASIKNTDRTLHCRVGVFVHFDGSGSPSGGPSVGYPASGNSPAIAAQWKALFGTVWPFGAWKSDNFTMNQSQYYGYERVIGSDGVVLVELGDLSNDDQAAWLKDRLIYLGDLLAHFVSRRLGKGNVPMPSASGTK